MSVNTKDDITQTEDFAKVAEYVQTNIAKALEDWNNKKTESMAIELTNMVIGVLDYCAAAGIDVSQDVMQKMWISTLDRQPNRGEEVIAFYEDMRGTTAEVQCNKGFSVLNPLSGASHWMPKPRPPQKK